MSKLSPNPGRKDRVYQVQKPCTPGYEGKWCRASYHVGGVSFFYFDTKEEACLTSCPKCGSIIEDSVNEKGRNPDHVRGCPFSGKPASMLITVQ